MIKITLPDGGVREYDASQITPMEIAKSLSNSLPKKAVAAKVDGEVKDLSTVLDQDAEVAILTFDDEEGKEVFRHSSSHVLAEAVQRLWQGTKTVFTMTLTARTRLCRKIWTRSKRK